ncbi:hypothetical protein DAPPUDRAFT_117217 [Daphnia pulex]|uniref:Uncharacterized protein n=1 Tax=Daphnia pulex TaxID=6669 RepID=E9HRX5_DAPPU|nr:hypothetical protein DAPPUDRAFT_117217 [Daphnia pulex]|eukprot:EFX65505.1 hypothetical protein DAPPUDRAFT_117217 [Daphnia pulex]
MAMTSGRDSLTNYLEKRKAYIHTGRHSYDQPWSELSSKYGIPGVIIQAQVRSFLDNTSATSCESVGRAVASIHGEESMGAFTYSRIQQQLIYKVSRGTTLHMQPAAVHPRIVTFVDFDKLIGVKVGVEELRVRGASGNPVAPKIQ